MLIIHGDDLKRSYEFLQQKLTAYRLQNIDIFSLDVSNSDITSIRQIIGSDNLFSLKKTVVLNGFLSTSKTKLKEEIIKMTTSADAVEIIFYETKELTPTSLKNLSSHQIEVFKVNPIIFKMMDSLKPGNQKLILSLYKQTLDSGIEPEYVFTMLVRQIRLLLQVKSDPQSAKMAPFVKRLFQSQSQYFSLDKLIDLHHYLYQIDKKIKTGSSATTSEYLVHHFLLRV